MKYVIGIGANIGFILENIKTSINIISSHKDIDLIDTARIYSSKALLKSDAPKDWDISFLNTAIKIQTYLSPQSLLVFLKFIEVKMGKSYHNARWSPRVIDLDILAAKDLLFHSKDLNIPHKELLNRSFALAPLLELENNWRHPAYYDEDLNKKLKVLDPVIKLKQRLMNTMRMGIVNLSTQSFSDGHFNNLERKSNMIKLINKGVEIIDIGAESTKPYASNIGIKEEVNKLDNFLSYIKSQYNYLIYKPLISIDTRKLEVMKQILLKHHDIIWMINDVECNKIDKKAKLINKYNKKYVIVHNLGIINRTQYLETENAMATVYKYFNDKKNILLKAGVDQNNIYFDLGFGFGKKTHTALFLLKNIEKIKKKLGLKALVSHSRKISVLNLPKNTDINILDLHTKKLTKNLESRDIDIVRIHKI